MSVLIHERRIEGESVEDEAYAKDQSGKDVTPLATAVLVSLLVAIVPQEIEENGR